MTNSISVQFLLVSVVVSLSAVPRVFSAPHEYVFSGPSVSGRFIVEEYVVPTHIPDDEQFLWTFVGPPYVFSGTAGALNFNADTFEVGVWNFAVAFGRTDFYSLYADNVQLTLSRTPSLALPYASSLPGSFDTCTGARLSILDPASGWVDFELTSVTPVSEPSTVSIGLFALICLALACRNCQTRVKLFRLRH